MARVKNLQDGLILKAQTLRAEEQREKEASVAFIEASKRAEQNGAIREKHAIAVEQALNILADAGVQL